MQNYIGQKVIIRGDRSGVFFGTLTAKDGREVEIAHARKLFYWNGAAAVEQIAVDGVKRPSDCQFTRWLESMIITDAIQILPCTELAASVIEGVAEWKR